MITAPDKTWRYLGPPRTASTLLHRVLKAEPYCGEATEWQHDMMPLPEGNLIVSVRSPWTRAISLWGHKRCDLYKAEHPEPYSGPTRSVSADAYPFLLFMHEVTDGKLTGFFEFSLTRWFKYVGKWQYIIRQEDIVGGLKTAFPELEPPPLKPTNRSFIEVPDNIYDDPKVVELVRVWAEDDFDLFDYPKEPQLCKKLD